MKKNLVITKIFFQSLSPSFYRGCTVLNFIYLFFKKWGAFNPLTTQRVDNSYRYR